MKKTLFCVVTIFVEILLMIGIFSSLATNLPLTIFLSLLFLLIMLCVVIGYNKLVNYKNKVKESLSLVDIQLKLRFDLIPNLVNIVKGYSTQEKEVFEKIAKLRSFVLDCEEEEQKIKYANKILAGIKDIVAIAENYPNLQASKLYKNFMQELVDVEDRISAARRIYDSNVNIYNTSIEVFPRNILAYFFEFEKEKLYKIDTGENININVGEIYGK